MNNKSVLIIEDEPGLVMTLKDRFTNERFEVTVKEDGLEGLSEAKTTRYDIIILDLMLPSLDGLEICRRLRSEQNNTPILMLTAKGQLVDKVVGLKLGADDYLAKPFDFAELLARVEAIMRRAERQHDSPGTSSKNNGEKQLRISETVHIYPTSGEVKVDGKPVALSTKEFQLLMYLTTHKGEAISRDTLLNEVWGYDALPTTRTVDTHVAWIRQKIEPNPKVPRIILTVHGVGYKLV